MKSHHYKTYVEWTGNLGTGTSDYRAYDRDHIIQIADKHVIKGSSDPAFRGNPIRHNPEELLVASLSACHMLCFLHLCSENGITVVEYTDNASGTMQEDGKGGGRFVEVILYPNVLIQQAANCDLANALHERAHKMCFIASSCNFPVKHAAKCRSRN